jgi:LCP family protein required for cell wall assembly
MSLPKPTARPSARATLLRWWQGWPRLVALGLFGLLGAGVALGAIQGIRILMVLDAGGGAPCRACEPPSDLYRNPRNVLVLGSDTRKGLSKQEQVQFGGPEDVPGRRSDTIILLHLDPRRETAVVVHFPRDLRIPIPGHGFGKINAAFGLGGPDLVVRAVHRFTGLPIHNYVVIDLAGFQHLVDTLGGVEICVDRPMHDELTGLAISTAGCHLLDGDQALAFVRARHIEGDPIPDFSRIARQQQFMRAMMNSLLSARSLLDTNIIADAVGNVTTDEAISGAELIYLGSKLRELAADDPAAARALDFRVVPARPRTIGGVAYVVADQPDAGQLFGRIRRGRPLGDLGKVLLLTDISPANIDVVVLEGGDPGNAAAAEAFLQGAGFSVLGTEKAPAARDRTEILFRPGMEGRAGVVSRYLPGLPVRRAPAALLGSADVAVVAADDYHLVAA